MVRSWKIAVPDSLCVLRFRTGLVIRGRHVAVPYLGLPLLVNLFCYLGAHYGFSHRREGVGYALRVSPVVTRLTVDRRRLVGREGNVGIGGGGAS